MDLARTSPDPKSASPDPKSASPGAEITPSRGDLEARVADLERIIEALVAGQTAAPRRNTLPGEPRQSTFSNSAPVRHLDPVALTEALHPRGLRTPRRSKRSTESGRRDLSMRLFVFTPPEH